jgi:processive 1,2-diacylglycerol beta-glucosyltransferase
MAKICPNCGERYKWYEAECPNCHVALVDAPDEQERLKNLELTVVFRTMEPGLLPLATLALEEQGIEFVSRLSGSDALTAGGVAYRGTTPEAPVEILVRTEDAAAASELLRDLEAQGKDAAAAAPPSPPAPIPFPTRTAAGDVELVDLASKSVVGRITRDDLAWLNSQLEKESEDDHDYYFDRPTLDMLEGKGASPQLMAVLRGALGSRDDMDLQWSRR